MKPASSVPASERDRSDPLPLTYRPDIDGLRAVAVIPVCLFHYGFGPVTGGFAGVDVFFVISGYLMASLIGKDLAGGKLSYLKFYKRRILRLFPALFTMIIATLAVSALFIPPKMFAELGKTTASSVLFYSNIQFALGSKNYFDAPTELNPLLHTWSLAVEEQFYILFPIYLAAIWRAGARCRLIITAAFAAVSLGAAVWGVGSAPTATFYLLPTRAWELLLGAMVALWSSGAAGSRSQGGGRASFANWASAGGLALILASFLLYDSETPFPGLSALAPCIGTATILALGADRRLIVSRILSIRPAVFVGKISYSLYLFHWPILVIADKYIWPGRLGTVQKAELLLVALLLSVASWKFIEGPFRRAGSFVPIRFVYLGAGVVAAVLVVLGYSIERNGGWAWRFPGIEAVSIQPQLEGERLKNPPPDAKAVTCFATDFASWGGDGCFLTSRGSENTLLWGDSFSNNYAIGIRNSPHITQNILQYSSPQCPPIFGYAAVSRPQCQEFNEHAVSIIKKYNIKSVIIAANWHSYLLRRKLSYWQIEGTILRLRKMGVRVIVIGQSPQFNFAYPDEYFFARYGNSIGSGGFVAETRDISVVNQQIERISGRDSFFNPSASLCNQNGCVFKKGGKYLFVDSGHFTGVGSELMVGELLRSGVAGGLVR